MSPRMPFGKHKGKELEDLPIDYLEWVMCWMDSEGSGWMSRGRSWLFDALEDEWERREGRPNVGPTLKPRMSPMARQLLPEFIKLGYRAMTMKCHPDKGGTSELMMALKELKGVLEKL